MLNILKISSQLVDSFNSNNWESFKKLRISIVAMIATRDYLYREIREYLSSYSLVEDNIVIGEALLLILSDMKKSGIAYKRMVLCSFYCLLKAVISDKANLNKDSVKASSLLLVLFYENKQFIQNQYIYHKVRGNYEIAENQYIGVTNVFFWFIIFSPYQVSFNDITKSRLKKALSDLVLDTPDVDVRRKIIDFEFENFKVVIDTIFYDLELHYPGLPYEDEGKLYQRILSLFCEKTSSDMISGEQQTLASSFIKIFGNSTNSFFDSANINSKYKQ